MRLDYEPQENEEIKEILPKDMLFHFGLTDGECHLKTTGVCSLDRWFPYKVKEIEGDANYIHCSKIFKSLVKYGQDFLIDIAKYRCGHYEFNDGQHRVCIAKRKDLKLKALITTVSDEDCDFCQKKFRNSNTELR